MKQKTSDLKIGRSQSAGSLGAFLRKLTPSVPPTVRARPFRSEVGDFSIEQFSIEQFSIEQLSIEQFWFEQYWA